MENKFDAVVVGAGISGLLSALALGREGKSVLVLEKSNVIGGNCRTYEVEETGFFVDTGVHAITGLKGGPLVQLMEKYFSATPKFVPHGEYYIREKDGMKKFPNTLQDLARFNAIPRKDRIILTKLLIGAVTDHAIFKNTDVAVYDYISDYNLSPKTLKFLDSLSYFLSGVSMNDTPVWRILGGGGLAEEGERKWRKKISDIMRLALNQTYAEQGYPRGGIGNLTKCILHSLPKNVLIKTSESVAEICGLKNCMEVSTENNSYKADIVIYSGEAKKLPDIAEMPREWSDSVKKLKQSKALTLWLGLKKPTDAFNYRGSEVWFSEGVSYWAMPTSSYDPHLAPAGKQLVGFTAFMGSGENPEKYGKKLLQTIYSAVPETEKNVEMVHSQIFVPEKAAISVGVKFPPVQTPVKNLYLVGTDADMRSMGITRASYSVIEMLKNIHSGRI